MGFGCVPPVCGYAITYPKSSSGPFHHWSPVDLNPFIGVPIAKFPNCCVPVIVGPILYVNGLEVGMFLNLSHGNNN